MTASSTVSRGRRSTRGSARGRVIEAAYDLFGCDSIATVGIDTIIARSGVAKMSFYKHFPSKEDLVLAFLDQRDERWTGWLVDRWEQAGPEPDAALMATFDALDTWFHEPDFCGCPLLRTVLDTPPGTRVHAAANRALNSSRELLRGLAEEAGLAEPEVFASAWHALMKGAIASAAEGHLDAARHARRAAELILKGWPLLRPRPGAPRRTL